MADDQKDNGQDQEEQKPLSPLEEKRKGLLDVLDDHLEKVGDNYGPILLEELQNRLEFIVKNFNEEVNSIFTESFKKWEVKDTQLRDLLSSDIQITKKKSKKKKSKDESVPEFVRDVKFGPVRPK